MNFSTKGLPRTLERVKAAHEPMVKPIVESTIPMTMPHTDNTHR